MTYIDVQENLETLGQVKRYVDNKINWHMHRWQNDLNSGRINSAARRLSVMKVRLLRAKWAIVEIEQLEQEPCQSSRLKQDILKIENFILKTGGFILAAEKHLAKLEQIRLEYKIREEKKLRREEKSKNKWPRYGRY